MTPTDIVTAFIKAMEKKDYDAGLKFVAPECEYTNIPMGTVTGPDGVRGALDPFFGPLIENDFRILRMAAQGPVVFVERLDRHHAAHGWFELPVTGVLEVHNGLITVWREYFDLATLQKGMTPAA